MTFSRKTRWHEHVRPYIPCTEWKRRGRTREKTEDAAADAAQAAEDVYKRQLVREVRSASGQTYDPLTPEVFRTVMSANSAEQLREMMELAVTSGTARRAALEDYTVAGKTGTAEVSDTDSKQPHAWFTGFVVEEEHPLAITVIVENGGGGGSVAAPIAQKVLQKAIDLGL